jgi:outer membrane receptor protein involved in Fe transport
MGYLTVSEGYRRGGINSGPPCPSPVPPEQSFCLAEDEVLIKPDKTINYEVGMHSTWVDGALLLNVAAYYIDWDDIQVLGTSEVGGVPIIVNGSSAESLGVELTGRWNITDALELSVAASYNQAELTEDAPGLVDGADAFAGDRLAGTPEVQGTMLLAYTRPLNNGLTLTADYSLTATSDVYTKVGLRNNGEVLGGYAVHGAAIGLAGDRWSARLYADNLFDKYAVTSVRRDTSYIRQVPDPLEVPDAPQYFDLRLYFESPLRPRTIGLEFGYRFDL